MFLKHFLLGTLLALSSVTAIPNPNTDDQGVEARDNDGDPAGYLVDRDHGFDCGRDATWDKKDKRCICKDHDKDYDWGSKKCRHNCGDDADWKDHHCVCKKTGQEYDKFHKECHCPRDKKWDDEKHKCVHDCGRDAYWDWKNRVCVCKNEDKYYNEQFKECKCTGGRWWDERKDKCRCPKGKKFDKTLNRCKRRHS